MIEICKICGKESDMRTHTRVHNISSKEYYDTYKKSETNCKCKTCGKETKFISIATGYREYCSVKCQRANEEVQNKFRESLANNAALHNIKVEAAKKIDYSKRLEKTKETNLEKFGVEAFSQTEEWKERVPIKLSIVNKEKYKNGESNLCSADFQNPWRNPNIIKKMREERLERNNGKWFSDDVHEKMEMNRLKKIQKRYETVTKVLSCKQSICECICEKCNEKFSMPVHIVRNRLLEKVNACPFCNPIQSKNLSSGEKNIVDFINSFFCNLDVLENNRRILPNGKELDIYIPSKKIAIEYDGLYWHSEQFKDEKTHLWKTEECEKQGIQLIHIFEDEWKYKQEIVKSRLKGLLGYNERIYARKTECREISYEESEKFLNENHIQGNCISKYRYGLFYNDELISVMTFGKSRFGNEFELLRFANKLYTNVVGGASKLFNHFMKDHPEINEIVSYADRRWSIGNLYKKLGFDKISVSAPSYFYVVKGIRENRMKYQKHKLVKEGYDPNKSEHEIMLEREIYRIYDCGNLKYEYRR